MGCVQNILTLKDKAPISVTPGTSIFEALELMLEKNISAVLVMENDELVGIFSERDYARKVILRGKASRDTKISEVMTDDLVTVTPNSTIV
ncbi:MAG: CBS domain-containing protein [Chitinophagaceae bacterium]